MDRGSPGARPMRPARGSSSESEILYPTQRFRDPEERGSRSSDIRRGSLCRPGGRSSSRWSLRPSSPTRSGLARSAPASSRNSTENRRTAPVTVDEASPKSASLPRNPAERPTRAHKQPSARLRKRDAIGPPPLPQRLRRARGRQAAGRPGFARRTKPSPGRSVRGRACTHPTRRAVSVPRPAPGSRRLERFPSVACPSHRPHRQELDGGLRRTLLRRLEPLPELALNRAKNLADPGFADPEDRADLAVRELLLVIQSEDLPLPLRKGGDGVAESAYVLRGGETGERVQGSVEAAVVDVLHRHEGLRVRQGARNAPACRVRLFRSQLAPELGAHPLLGAVGLAARAALASREVIFGPEDIEDRALDAPSRIRLERDAAALVVPVGRVDESEHARRDQVVDVHALRNAACEPEGDALREARVREDALGPQVV